MKVRDLTTKFEGSAWVSQFSIAMTPTTSKTQYAVDYCSDGTLVQTISIADTVDEAISKARAKGL